MQAAAAREEDASTALTPRQTDRGEHGDRGDEYAYRCTTLVLISRCSLTSGTRSGAPMQTKLPAARAGSPIGSKRCVVAYATSPDPVRAHK